MRQSQSTLLLAAVLCCATTCTVVLHAEDLDFNRDVRPVLSEKCFSCHGPDARSLQGGLRLDLRDRSIVPAESGNIPIVPNHPDRSELVKRILSTDADTVMPPPASHRELTQADRQILQQWIAEGAEYQDHWSFLKPVRRLPETAMDAAWNRNAIDRFVMAALQKRGLTPSAPANPETLIRRVSLDLRGLPPSIQEIDQFLADTSDGAYERMVDQMLSSPHFGERMAMIWLDLARYGDTNGYHADSDRPVWVWRDWVVDAFNHNLPFDQFTIWQLAGDLLPDATMEQKIASGFNRNVRFNEEGGADPEEFLAAYAADRTITLGRIWLGLTLNCAQCHSHKYDPISQAEFYQLTAFFNSLEEEGAGGVTGFHGKPVPPVLRVQTAGMVQELSAARQQLTTIERQIAEKIRTASATDPGYAGRPEDHREISRSAWEAFLQTAKPPTSPAAMAHWDFRGGLSDLSGDLDVSLVSGAVTSADGLILDGKSAYALTSPLKTELKAKTLEAWVRLSTLNQGGGAVIGIQTLQENPNAMAFDAIVFGEQEPGRWMAGSDHFHRTQPFGGEPETEADRDYVHVTIVYETDGTIRAYRNGVAYGQPYRRTELRPFPAGQARVVFGARALPPGANFMLSGTIREARLYDRALTAEEVAASAGSITAGVPAPVLAAVQTTESERTEEQNTLIQDYYFRRVHAATRDKISPLETDARKLKERIMVLSTEANFPLQMVSVEMAAPRPAFVLKRGDFQTPGEPVERNVPAFLPPMEAPLPRNRLGLARWLMQSNQPLVARVQVNRFWQQLFGEGLVQSVGDFGLQGSYPSHPELLDWLSLDFVESGWDIKRLLRQIICSQTYRQSSSDTRRYAEQDPQNRLLWRAPRVRLQAEVIRDNALAAAGLLSPKIGGTPVFPWQPVDYYKGKNNGWPWAMSTGDDLYRRGLYTFWRRTTPYPSFVIFDAPDRAECTFERPRTNTPLQALVTLNDPQFVEASRVLAERLLSEETETDARISLGYRLTTARRPQDHELQLLRDFLAGQLHYFRDNPDAAASLTAVGKAPPAATSDPAIVAAWMALSGVLLNLDETITRN